MLTNIGNNSAQQIAWSALHTRKWRNLTRLQKKWILEKAHRLYRKFVTENHWIPHRSERRVLIENLYRQINDRGIMIYKGEVFRVIDHRIRKWNRRYLEKEMEKARQVVQNRIETAE